MKLRISSSVSVKYFTKLLQVNAIKILCFLNRLISKAKLECQGFIFMFSLYRFESLKATANIP